MYIGHGMGVAPEVRSGIISAVIAGQPAAASYFPANGADSYLAPVLWWASQYHGVTKLDPIAVDLSPTGGDGKGNYTLTQYLAAVDRATPQMFPPSVTSIGANTAGFSLSSIPLWAWAAGGIGLLFMFKGGGGRGR